MSCLSFCSEAPKSDVGSSPGRIVEICWIVMTVDDSRKSPLTGAFYVGLLDGLLGVAGMIITSDYGSFPKIPC